MAPIAERPWMPGYGISPSVEGLLPWSWAVERLSASHNYWVGSVGDDGSPHAAAVWGVWLEPPGGALGEGAFLFSTGGRSRKARNLRREPRCTVTTEGAGEAVVVRGLATPVDATDRLERARQAYESKYGEGFPDPAENPVLAVRPRLVVATIEHEPDFTTRATRWRFAR